MTETAENRKARVAIVRAGEYDVGRLREAVDRAVDLIGGIADLVRPGCRVFVKINHLPPPSPPERGIVTHPVFAEAVIGMLKEAGAEVTVGDDIEASDDAYSVTGYSQMCERAGVPLLNLREAGFVKTDTGGRLVGRAFVSRAALEADVIVNLPKLKTHSLTVYTGAVKNMYGTLPGSLRRRFHGEFVKSEDFATMLTDVFAAVRPHLTVMDAVYAMEGAGPSAGPTRNTGIVLASRDAVALDAVAGKVIGLEPEDVDTTRLCHERGLGVGDLASIEVLGERIDAVAVPDFELPAVASRLILRRVPPRLSRFVLRQASVRPRVLAARCTACAECVRVCPTGAMSLDGTAADVNRPTCVECLCCHEVCRYDAIDLVRPPVSAALLRLAGAFSRRRS